jgi:spoIIIJ-associated protein
VRSAEGSGRTVEEAIREALRVLGARREDVDLMVLDEGSRGVLGIGAREARVRLTLLSEENEEDTGFPVPVERPSGQTGDDPIAVARNVTSSLIEAMDFHGTVRARGEAGAVLVSISGPALAPLIGRHGQTLDALELVVNLMAARRLGRRLSIVVDAEHYRERRREALQALARRTASRVRRTGRPAALEPMSASERRVIHTALAEDAGVTTHSEGEGDKRHVIVSPRTGAAAPGSDRPARANHTARRHAEEPVGSEETDEPE